MKENLQTRVFEWVQSAAEKVSEFTIKEIPPFIHEYLQWKFIEVSIPVVLYTIYIIFLTVATFRYIIPLWKWAIKMVGESSYSNNKEFTPLLPIFLTTPLIVVIFAAFPYSEIKDCLMIKFAPKVYLVEKVSEILKK